MAIAGLRGSGNWGTDERPTNFREGIMRFNPAGTAPLFAMTSKSKKGRALDDSQYSWWGEGNTLIRLQINGARLSTDTLITVDSLDPSATTFGANYGTATNLKPGDLLLVEPSADNATFDHEILEVDNVLGDTQFTVRRGAGGTTAAAIADDRWLSTIGSAYAEGTGVPRATSRNPIKFTNYTQIFKDTYELTGTADKTKTRTNNNYSEDKRRKRFKHASDIEMAILFGRAAETTGDNGKPKRFTGGLRATIPASNVTIFSAAVTPSSLLDAISPVFDFDTGAGSERIILAGNAALIALSKVFADQVMFTVNGTIKEYGMDFTKFTLPMGTVMLKSHPLLSRMGAVYSKSAFVCDFDSISWNHMKDRDTKEKDDVQTEDEDVRRGFIMTDGGVEIHNGGLTMAYLGNISAT